MAEWSKANDSKSFNGKLFVGSNPTLSVFKTSLVDLYTVFSGDFRVYNRDKSLILTPHLYFMSKMVVVDVVADKKCVVVDI